MLRQYIELFPESGLAIVLKAYLDSELSPFTPKFEENSQDDPKLSEDVPQNETPDDTEEEETLADRILGAMMVSLPKHILNIPMSDIIQEGVQKSPNSVLSHRLLAEYYVFLEEFDDAVEIGRKGQKLVTAESIRTGLALQR